MNYPTYGTPMPGRVRFEWIGEAWALLWAQGGTWIVSMLVYGILSIAVTLAIFVAVLGAMLPGALTASAWTHGGAFHGASDLFSQSVGVVAELIVGIVSAVLGAFFYGGLFQMANKQLRGEDIQVGDLFSGGPVILPMLGYSFVFGIMFNIGLRLCLIPGIIVGALWWPGYALIADRQTFSWSFQRSMNAMTPDFLNACLFAFVWGLILTFGTIFTCGLGLLVLTPMCYILASLIYRDMIGMPGVPPVATGYVGPQAPGPYTPPGAWPPAPHLPPAPQMPPQMPPAPPDPLNRPAPPPDQNPGGGWPPTAQ